MQRFKLPALFALAFGLVYAFIFDSKLDMGGDNAGYYILGRALLQGEGYTNIHIPGTPAASHFPPGYPALLAVAMLFGKSFTWLKVVNGILFGAALWWFRSIAEKATGSTAFAWVAVLLVGLNSHLLRSSTIMMSEIPYTAASILALWTLLRWDPESKAFYRSYDFWLVVVLASAAFYIRTAGIALGAGIGLYLLFERRWAAAFTFGGAFFALYLPWVLRGRAVDAGSAYVDQLLSVNPYRPEEGQIDVSGLWDRIAENAGRYLGQELPNSMIPSLTVDYNPEAPVSHPFVGLLLLGLIAYGIVRLPKLRWLVAGYVLASFAIFLVWPSVWYGVRFIQPLVPVLVLSAVYGAWELLRRVLPSWNPWWFAALGLLLLAPVRTLNDEAKLDYPMPYQNYFRLGEFAKANVPVDAQFATTKPALWYLFAERKATRIPTEADPALFMQRLQEEGLNYVVVDQLGYGSVGRYFVPAYQAYPERFELVAQLPNPDTYIFKVK
ncbi:MAG: ArnT family glycosyltransferase [Bacteroidota bacterium]|jgi:hypothetical protein